MRMGVVSSFHRIRAGDRGRSLPAVLVALSVGAILLGPFLSHVSTRMLATREVNANFGQQFATDSGVEFAIWKLLNDSTFRNQADANIGTAIPITPDIDVNGETTSITVTALPLGEWSVLADAPAAINDGGAVAANGSSVYVQRGGGSDDFWRYNVGADDWTPGVDDTIRAVTAGGSLIHADGDWYGLHSPGCFLFFCWEFMYRFDGSVWDQMAGQFAFGSWKGNGSAIAYDNSDSIYILRGRGSSDFRRYNLEPADNWQGRSGAPGGVTAGGALAYAGGDEFYAFQGGDQDNFWLYDAGANSWSNGPSSAPANVGGGGALAADGDNYVYGLRGNGTTDVWRYNISGDFWQPLASAPDTVSGGGSLSYAGGVTFYATRGGNNTDFWRFRITPPRYDISAIAGDVTIDARIEIAGSSVSVVFWDIN